MSNFERHGTQGAREREPANVIPLVSRARDFIVITTQRTGSSWLMDRLDHSPEVEGHMELFYFDVRREPPRAGCNDYPRFVEARGEGERRPFAVFNYLNRLYARRHAIGFKLMYSQLREYPEILPWMAVRRLPVVHLLRANHLDVIISERLASATGSSHATVEESRKAGRPVEVRLDPRATLERIRRLEHKQHAMRRLLKCLPNPCLEVTYEALCNEPQEFKRLFAFLRMDPTLVTGSSRLVKRQRARHHEVIANYPEVRESLVAAGYGSLLHEEPRERHDA